MDDSDPKIVELRRQNQQLREQLNENINLLNIVLNDSGLVLWEQHIPSGRLSLYNSEYGKICGLSANEQKAYYKNWQSNLHPDDKDFAIKAFEALIAGETDEYDVEYKMLHKDGSIRWVKDRGTIQDYDENGHPLRVLGTHSDITQQRIAHQRLAKLAHHDPLTGLLNRHAFRNQFEQYCQNIGAEGGTLMFIDLDKFKPVNDRYGHTVGDRILKCCAERIQQHCPEQGQCGRIGGDEFALLIPFSEVSQLKQLSKRLLDAFTPAIDYQQISVAVTISIGMCRFHRHDEQFEQTLHRADQAMYQVKDEGKNNFHLWGFNSEA
ncbi:sensor domain-containing diguanylate cyclase [Agarivorans sp. QJM3NY_29]|uniref:sensor domain-containing diguanylate cyclase n=1 Tax=unclassified Agarivorans TaxID=2636026 RepID=UPI003D7C94DC